MAFVRRFSASQTIERLEKPLGGHSQESLTLKTLVENSESRAFYTSLGMAEGNRSLNAFSGREEIEYARRP